MVLCIMNMIGNEGPIPDQAEQAQLGSCKAHLHQMSAEKSKVKYHALFNKSKAYI